jgi:Zn-dependent protease/CBS domain-containing protein
MKWSWKFGRIAGVDLRMHVTFLALIAWLVASYWLAGRSLSGVVAGVGFILALFACVVLHEMGHVLAARQFGIRTRDITLLPIGGLARLERMPEEPSQELWIALAGPAVSLGIAAVLDSWLTFTNAWAPLSQLHITAGPWVERLFLANISLVLFNLIPAFPMDGGRVLRAILAWRMGYPRATEVAASVGQVLAFVIGLIGLFTSPTLLFVGLFVWIGATQEANIVQVRSVLSNAPMRAAMFTDFAILRSSDALAEAVRFALNGSQRDFPVVDAGKVTGMVTESDMLAALSTDGPEQPVGSVMRREFPVADSSETLEAVFRRLQEDGAGTIPVVSNGVLVGLVTMENLREYLMIQAALKARSIRAGHIRQSVNPGVGGD